MLPSITLYQEFLETWPFPNIKRGWTIVQLGLNFVFILTLLFLLDGFEIKIPYLDYLILDYALRI